MAKIEIAKKSTAAQIKRSVGVTKAQALAAKRAVKRVRGQRR